MQPKQIHTNLANRPDEQSGNDFDRLERMRNSGVVVVKFSFRSGLRRSVFKNVKLWGSWSLKGQYSDTWTSVPMLMQATDDGCESFSAEVQFDQSQIGWTFHWSVSADTDSQSEINIVMTEVHDGKSMDRRLSFELEPVQFPFQNVSYKLLNSRWLGAQRLFPVGISFRTWAPNARDVEVVFGKLTAKQDDTGTWIVDSTGHISDVDYGSIGLDEQAFSYKLLRSEQDAECWTVELPNKLFQDFDHRPYMYKITRDDGSLVYRTDIYSRCQIGGGEFNPKGKPYYGSYKDVDGTVSCSVVVDPNTVAASLKEADSLRPSVISEEKFWADEFDSSKPVPRNIEDLIIYELHIGSLGDVNSKVPGSFNDAIVLLDYLLDMGINAVELLPMSEFGGSIVWGYGTSHYFALEFSAGGRDKFKYFVKECHKRGMAVLIDVCYNHFAHEAERAEFNYDSTLPEKNSYYWYEGTSSQYEYSDGGYIDNGSTGYCPRFHEESLRKLFISSAAALMEEFHIDGFRVDLTEAIYKNNCLHANGQSVPSANEFGMKFLREWSRTLKTLNPKVILIAEDHSKWDKVTESTEIGGLGFDACWYVDFCHHLVGSRKGGIEWAKLIMTAGYGKDDALAIDYLAGALEASAHKKVVYHTSHDEAGNADGTMRTIQAACNEAPLVGETRRYAEARVKFALGMNLLSAGTPMILMGEEVGCTKPFTYSNFLANRENLDDLRTHIGKDLFDFCRRLISLRLSKPALRSREIDVVYTHNENRIIAFKRSAGNKQIFVAASLNNHAFDNGYFIHTSALGNRKWQEIFSSENPIGAGTVYSNESGINVKIPANGFVVLESIE